MSIPVKRVLRNKVISDPNSPKLYYLKPCAGFTRVHTLEDLARDIELIGSMSMEDVEHVIKSVTRRMKTSLTNGDRIKIDGLGTFYITFNCTGAEEEKDCTVKNIRKVNIRFKTDSSLRLTNDSIASSRNADNNVGFYIKNDTGASGGSEGGSDGSGGGNNGGDNGGDNGGWTNPID
jgi:Bacterial nucleoid DNA-binding protein